MADLATLLHNAQEIGRAALKARHPDESTQELREHYHPMSYDEAPLVRHPIVETSFHRYPLCVTSKGKRCARCACSSYHNEANALDQGTLCARPGRAEWDEFGNQWHGSTSEPMQC